MLRATSSTCEVSRLPFGRLGVPTQTSESSDQEIACSTSEVADRRPASTASRISSSTPGSTIGLRPATICAFLSALTSTPSTSCPNRARQAAQTVPTYPNPKIETRIVSLSAFLRRYRSAAFRDHVGKDAVEVPLGHPPDRLADLPDRRLAVEGVLDALLVDLVVRDEDDLGVAAGRLLHAVGEVEDPHALRGADVEDVARDLARVHQPREGADRVGDVAERARLRAVTVYLDRLAGERALDHARDHHPVAAALPRPDGVEQPHDHRVEAALEVVREREVLVHRLRVGV